MGYQPKYDMNGVKVKDPPMTRKDWAAIAILIAFVCYLGFCLWYVTNYAAEHIH